MLICMRRRGALTTVDLSMVVLAGSTLGGGTTVNWSTSLRPPDRVRAEWAAHGFTGAYWTVSTCRSYDAVSERMNIQSNESPANQQNALLEQGCKDVGL